jgi:hypothetical protein
MATQADVKTDYDPIDLANYGRRFGYVLAWVGNTGWRSGPAPWTISNSLKAARTNGLVESRDGGAPGRPHCDWKLTPLGVAAVHAFKAEHFPEEMLR